MRSRRKKYKPTHSNLSSRAIVGYDPEDIRAAHLALEDQITLIDTIARQELQTFLELYHQKQLEYEYLQLIYRGVAEKESALLHRGKLQ